MKTSSDNKFKKLKKMLNKGPIAKAEAEASKNPQKFLKDMKNPSIKSLKGIAF